MAIVADSCKFHRRRIWYAIDGAGCGRLEATQRCPRGAPVHYGGAFVSSIQAASPHLVGLRIDQIDVTPHLITLAVCLEARCPLCH